MARYRFESEQGIAEYSTMTLDQLLSTLSKNNYVPIEDLKLVFNSSATTYDQTPSVMGRIAREGLASYFSSNIHLLQRLQRQFEQNRELEKTARAAYFPFDLTPSEYVEVTTRIQECKIFMNTSILLGHIDERKVS